MKAIIFDLDGTLLNSLQDLANSVNKVLVQHNQAPHPLEKYNQFVGNGVQKLVERAFGSDYDKLDEAFDSFLEDYTENCINDSKPYEGILNLLQWANTKDIPIAISTNKAQDLTDKIVAHYFKDIDFVDVIGDRYDGLKKPNPYYPLQIAEKMQTKAEDILFVGDSDVDMMTANSAGFVALGVSWGFRSEKELLAHGASKIITNAHQIRNYF